MRARLLYVMVVVIGCGPSPEGTPMDPDGGEGAPDAEVEVADAAPRPDARPEPFTMYAHTADTLYRVDDLTFDLILIGSFGLTDDSITDLAVTPDGTLYGISSSRLYTVDEDDGAATFVANVPGLDNVGMTFLVDGTLLATDATGGVRRIDPSSGLVTEIGEFGGGFATAGDLVAVLDGTMYAISDEGPDGDEWDNNLLLTVNTQTGVAASVGKIGYGQVFGAAFANGHVFAFTADGELIEIDRTTGAGTLIRSYPVTFWGAGVTPLVPIE